MNKLFINQDPIDFPYFIKKGTEMNNNGIIYDKIMMQISLSSWMTITKNNIKNHQKLVDDFLFFNTKQEVKDYLDNFDNTNLKLFKLKTKEKDSAEELNTKFYESIVSQRNLDTPILYVKTSSNNRIEDNWTNRQIKSSHNDDDFLKYSIVRFYLFDQNKNDSFTY
jgi:hypothetical protein